MVEGRLREDWRHTCALVNVWGGKLKNPYETGGRTRSHGPLLSPKESVSYLAALVGLGEIGG